MFTTVLTPAMRETFNELANRDMEAEHIRSMFNQEQWMSEDTEIFYITHQQRDYLLSIWSILS